MKSRKQRRTFSTDDVRKTIRHNLAMHEWARKMATQHPYAELSDEKVYSLMPTARIKWVNLVNELAGCPVHGTEIKVKGPDPRYCWVADPVNHPYKLQCSVEGEFYPSNDFGSGDRTSGDFPDDGTGFVQNGQRYYFLGEYCHRAYIGHVVPGMVALAEMYEQTGDLKYARKAALILYRIAEEYPNATDRRDRCFDGSYGVYSGMLSDRIWSSEALRKHAIVYDTIFDALDEDPGIVDFIRRCNPEIASADAYRAYIEEHLLLPGIQAHFDRAVSPNIGTVQKALTTVASVLDDFSDRHPNSLDIIRWLYEKAPGPERYFFANVIHKDGSSFESPSYDAHCRSEILEAGVIMERLRRRHPDALPEKEFPDFLHHPRLREFINHYAAMICLDRFPIRIADTGGTPGTPKSHWKIKHNMVSKELMDRAYREFDDPSCAPALIEPDGTVFHALDRDPMDEKIRADAKAVLAQTEKTSEVRDGYKAAILRRGRGEHRGVVTLFYGAPRTHAHNDPLNLSLFARGEDLMPELGYPMSWKLGAAWESNIFGHNTAIVDRKDPERHHHWGCKLDVGMAHAFVDAGSVQLVDLEQDPYRITSHRADDDLEEQPSYHRPSAGRPTPRVDVYRRFVMLVDVSEEDFYVVDVFRLRGGIEHHLAIHGPPGRASVSGVQLEKQSGGTLGDPTGHYGKPYVDGLGESALDPFSMITNVSRGLLDGPASITYSTGEEPSAGVRFIALPEQGTLLEVGDGRPPANPKQYKLKMAYLSRKGDESLSNVFVLRTEENRLSSQFVTVIEPRGTKAVVTSAQRLKVKTDAECEVQNEKCKMKNAKSEDGAFDPVCLQVKRKGGTDLIIMQPGYSGRVVEVEGFSTDAAYAVATLSAGRPKRVTLFGGTCARIGDVALKLNAATLRGKIGAVDRARRTVRIEGFSGKLNLAGQRVRFHNRRHSAMYTIVSAQALTDGVWELTLDFDSCIGAGKVTGVSDGILKSRGQMVFAGLTAKGDGTFVDRYSEYAGATVENASGRGAFVIRGITGIIAYYNQPHDVHIDREAHPEANEALLEASYPEGSEFFVYDYGVGDEAEVLNWATATKSGDSWEVRSVGEACRVSIG